MESISEFFNDRHVFITGGSGFIGKVLVEKLLRSFPRIGGVYLLLRPKHDKSTEERLQKDVLEAKMFDKIRDSDPTLFEKLHIIAGDLMADELGISKEDLELMADNVNVVIHSAATIRFNDHIRLSARMNFIGTRKVVALCRKLPKLESFVHVSTAYANCDILHIEEVIYPISVQPSQLESALDWMDDEMLTKVTPSMLKEKPNTYTFTKHMAEVMLAQEATDLPLAIVRPSIVGAAISEPMPGWIDNYNGPGGFYVAAGKGLLRSVFLDAKAVADIVPVDYTVNMIIAVAWFTAVKQQLEPAPVPGLPRVGSHVHWDSSTFSAKHPDPSSPSSNEEKRIVRTKSDRKPLIYHCTTGTVNPFTWEEMEIAIRKIWKQFPLEECLRVPTWQLTNNSLLHNYWV